MRTSHGGTLHISVAALADMLWKCRKDTSYLAHLVSFVCILPVIVLVSARSRDCRSRSIVAVYSRGKVACSRSHCHEVRICSRIACCRSSLVSACKDDKTAVDHAVRRTCMMNEIVKRLSFEDIVCLPLLVSRILRSPFIWIGCA